MVSRWRKPKPPRGLGDRTILPPWPNMWQNGRAHRQDTGRIGHDEPMRYISGQTLFVRQS